MLGKLRRDWTSDQNPSNPSLKIGENSTNQGTVTTIEEIQNSQFGSKNLAQGHWPCTISFLPYTGCHPDDIFAAKIVSFHDGILLTPL